MASPIYAWLEVIANLVHVSTWERVAASTAPGP